MKKSLKKSYWFTVILGLIALFQYPPNLQAALPDGNSLSPSAPVLLYGVAVRGPAKSNPAYPAWAADMVSRMYNGQSLGTNAVTGYYLDTTNISQDAVGTNQDTLWFMIHVVAADPSYSFSPHQLYFWEHSSDPGDSLADSDDLSDTNIIYTSSALGIIWGSNGTNVGPRFNDTLLESQSWSQNVNEFIFIGAMSQYYTYTNAPSRLAIDTYVDYWPDYELTGVWQFTYGSSSTLLAKKTFYRKATPYPFKLSEQAIDPNNTVSLGVTAGTNDTYTIQYSPSVQYPQWTDAATVNAGWNEGWIHTNRMGYFRWTMQ